MREKLNIGDIFGRWTIADNEYVLERAIVNICVNVLVENTLGDT